MTDTAEQVKEALLDAVVELAERRQGSATQGDAHHSGTDQNGAAPNDARAAVAGELIRHYFARTAPQDLAGKDPIDLYAATIRHLQLAERRAPTESSIQIYNPNSDEDGWTSSHTVIDIVTEDMPFIVDSVLALLERLGHQVHVLVHPMFEIARSEAGGLDSVKTPSHTSPSLESVLHVEIDRLSSDARLNELETLLRSVLSDVRAAVEDWQPMRQRVLAIAGELDTWAAEAQAGNPRFVAEIGGEPSEVAALLRWMEDESFVFVGYREYDFNEDPDHPTIVSRPETGLGTLRQDTATTRDLGELPPETAAQARKPNVLNLTKTNTTSTVHRSVPLDYVGIKELDAEGRVTGERRILGMFTSSVYSGQVEDIPTVRVKVNAVTERAAFVSTSHDYSRLLNTLQTFPRDELFQIGVDELESMALAILDLRDRRQVSMLMRRDLYGRFLSCLVFVPRDRHSTDVRLQIQTTLMEVYKGTSVRYSTEISDAPLARLHLVIYTDPVAADELPDTAAVEARLVQATRTWDDYLRASLIEAHGEEQGLDLLAVYGDAFDPSYRSHVLAESAVHDIERLEQLDDSGIDVFLHRPLESGRFELRCKVYRSGKPIALSQLVPLLHDLGAVVVDERPYQVNPHGSSHRFVYDIGLELPSELNRDDRRRVRDAVLAVWNSEAETDGLAQMVVSAKLTWHDVSVLRAYSRYLVQIGSPFSFNYIVDTLNGHPEIARQLIRLFHHRFNPDGGASETGATDEDSAVSTELLEAIDSVASLDADRILRSFFTVINATVRTNHWQVDDTGSRRDALAFKIDPTTIPDLPKPVPSAEIFVYSPRTEGVHLRSGRVARGGLRWSERMEDYRTEILGLMKAQTVKNSVIVPVGAKGGFVARNVPTSGPRDQVMAEVVACYKIFVSALLDVTDNVVDDRTDPPTMVVRHDGDDPYLVVAADKGTATFSDTANGIAADRGFWLDDAFASGGSAGYDHKALAITARGAWVSVQRHFRDLGLNPETTPFTAVGVGDMSGDVFGNGMLRSDQTRLVAAFDHRHIFVDPDPDPATSFAERTRLFEMDRSSWDDYNTDLISAGGGVFPRTAKSIDITTEMAHALGLDPAPTNLRPDDLIRAVLLAPVDLLWNGGIGTYIKASTEADLEVGDRGNDAVRVDGNEVRCKVIAEGGNLGVSQLGRIEYAALGGRINTDAIDNSGGVDCSDHEVNLKILLAVAERNGDLTRKHRNQLLESMADEVCDLVLQNNYAQNRTLSAAVAEAPGMIQVHERVMTWLEESAGLDRAVELLPTSLEVQERVDHGVGLTRPELAVLLAYAKNSITEKLLVSKLASNGEIDELLFSYFPAAVIDQHAELVRAHPLRQELTATLLSNQVVNSGGISMVPRLIEETSATVSDISLAHMAAWQIYGLGELWNQVQQVDDQLIAQTQTNLELEIMKLGERATRWLLRNEPQPLQVADVVQRYRESIRSLQQQAADGEHPPRVMARIGTYVEGGTPAELATRVAWLGRAYGFLDLSTVAQRTQRPIAEVAEIHGLLEERLELSSLREWVVALPRDDHWQTMARGALRDQYFSEHAELTALVLSYLSSNAEPEKQVDVWLKENTVAASRCRRTFAEIEAIGDRDLSHVSVALRAIAQLRRSI